MRYFDSSIVAWFIIACNSSVVLSFVTHHIQNHHSYLARLETINNAVGDDSIESLWLLEEEDGGDEDDDDFQFQSPLPTIKSTAKRSTATQKELLNRTSMNRSSKEGQRRNVDQEIIREDSSDNNKVQTVGVGRHGYNMTTLHNVNYDVKRYFPSNEEITYQIRLDLLKEYHKLHGDCNVPFRYTCDVFDYGLGGEKKETYSIALGRWLHNLRKRYQSNQEKVPEKFKRELDSLGINWDGVGARKRPGTFRNRCNQLKEFTMKNGHDRVPLVSETRSLGLWVERQKALYRKLLEGGDCGDQLPPERVMLLRDSGLNLDFLENESKNGRYSVRQKLFDKEWQSIYNLLKTHQDQNGKFDVTYDPQSEHFGSLLRFVAEQRYQYEIVRNAYFSGVGIIKSTLTPERLQALVDIKFDFSSELPLPCPWNDIVYETFDVVINMKLMKEHRDKTGSCDITLVDVYASKNVGEMLRMFRFQQRLRWEYRNTESSSFQRKIDFLIDRPEFDLVEKLNKLEFCWDCVSVTTPSTADMEEEFEWWEMYHDLVRYRHVNGDYLLEPGSVWYSTELDDWFQEQNVKFSNIFNLISSKDEESCTLPLSEWHYLVLKSAGFGTSSDGCLLPYSAGRKPAVLNLEPNLLAQIDGLPSELQELAMHGNRIQKAEQLAWLIRFASIRRYYSLEGPGNLSNLSPDDTSGHRLLMWANHQRKQYANFLQGKKSTITKKRIELLNSIGFDWTINAPGGREEWEEMKSELIQFREQFGHCFVPAAYPLNKKLGQWVLLQRQIYQHGRNAKKHGFMLPTTLSKDKEKELVDIGLDLKLDNLSFGNMAYEVMWKCRIKELASFKEIHGHCDVPLDYTSPYYDLGVWAREQRILYTRLKEGISSQLNKSRADDLEQIGFAW
eukprot:CAMPEP_0176482130 /NCGR_PEP_ID=MMETSP0200_2-20121128/3208_1 /TAXON_ID=947934 /ORGANISM="Chaetoceros sp., Strain GSL56" /LENGTH=897 /DNA_ID=CAMNT_0017878419 /DNA_START=78 /DNA_END=2768 /DNA_ORIENTATION=-